MRCIKFCKISSLLFVWRTGKLNLEDKSYAAIYDHTQNMNYSYFEMFCSMATSFHDASAPPEESYSIPSLCHASVPKMKKLIFSSGIDYSYYPFFLLTFLCRPRIKNHDNSRNQHRLYSFLCFLLTNFCVPRIKKTSVVLVN